MPKLMWNSDLMPMKKQIVREKGPEKSGSDSSGTHESFPVHCLADKDGCQQQASVRLAGYEDGGGSEEHSPHSPHAKFPYAKEDQPIPFLASKPLKGGKLVLRPYGLAEEVTAKAELLQRVLDGQFELQSSGQTVARQHIRSISEYLLSFPF